jgi:anaerobic sulfite reductase subunit A
MGYHLSVPAMDGLLSELGKHYRVFAPKRPQVDGGLVRYGEVGSLGDMVLDVPSLFSPKEVLYPIVETLFTFRGGECIEESDPDGRGIILFARPCDVNGIRRLDRMFLENGGIADPSYARMREKLTVFLIECTRGWDTCFCVSLGANTTTDYSAAFRFGGEGVLVDVKDPAWEGFFAGNEPCAFTPAFVQSNPTTVTVPEIEAALLPQVHALALWQEYNEQ